MTYILLLNSELKLVEEIILCVTSRVIVEYKQDIKRLLHFENVHFIHRIDLKERGMNTFLL